MGLHRVFGRVNSHSTWVGGVRSCQQRRQRSSKRHCPKNDERVVAQKIPLHRHHNLSVSGQVSFAFSYRLDFCSKHKPL